jgi:predicted DNA-binding transcriptional regulator AlpA
MTRQSTIASPSGETDPIANQLYGTADVARLLQVSVKTIESWRSNGKVALPYIRPTGSRSVRYLGADIIRFINESRRMSTSDD